MEQQVIMLSDHLSCKIVALHENLYMQEEDYFAYEVATAIDRGVKLNETVQLNKKKGPTMHACLKRSPGCSPPAEKLTAKQSMASAIERKISSMMLIDKVLVFH